MLIGDWCINTGLGIGVPWVIAMGMIVWWRCKRKNGDLDAINRYTSRSIIEGSNNVYFGIPVFSYSELQAATNDFDPSTELGDGGFGTVYYGKKINNYIYSLSVVEFFIFLSKSIVRFIHQVFLMMGELLLSSSCSKTI